MKKLVFVALAFCSSMAMACEEDAQSVGGPVTDGQVSSKPGGVSAGLSGLGASTQSGDCVVEIGDIRVQGTSPGFGWAPWHSPGVWIYIGTGGGGSGSGNPDPDPDPEVDCAVFESAAMCIATTVGGSAGFVALMETATCGSCMTTPNLISCGACALVLGVSAVVLTEAVEGACAPNEDIPPQCFD